MELWTQRYGVGWPKLLSFYERRYEILRSFEDKGILRQFRSDEALIGARLGGPMQNLSFGVDELTAGIYSPDADAELVLDAVRLAIETLQPHRVSRPSVGLQWLIPVDEEYNVARNDALRRLLGFSDELSTALAGTSQGDYAFLLDGEHELGDYKIELGVVKTEEIPRRLSRNAGRAAIADPWSPASLWPIDSLPEVAYFGDVEWVGTPLGNASADDVLDSWSELRSVATAVATELFRALGALDE